MPSHAFAPAVADAAASLAVFAALFALLVASVMFLLKLFTVFMYPCVNSSISSYFKGKDRNSIIRSASEFMMNFTKPCRLELDGYKGTYIGFITSNDYEKKNVKQRYVVNVEFDGFFVDDDLSITFDGKTSASFYKVGTRDTPCVVEVYAKSTLTNYTINGLGEDIVVESLAAGKTVVIDAKTGLVTIDGANAFDKVDLWEFPVLKAGETALTFSNTKARVTVRYTPMWI